MPSLGFQEIAVIFLLALLVFGPKKLPEIGRTLGGAMRELRKAAKDFSTSIEQLEKEDDDDTDDTPHTDSQMGIDDRHVEDDDAPTGTDDDETEKKE